MFRWISESADAHIPSFPSPIIIHLSFEHPFANHLHLPQRFSGRNRNLPARFRLLARPLLCHSAHTPPRPVEAHLRLRQSFSRGPLYPGIFAWRKQVPRITYLLSKDVLKHRRAQAAEADVWLAKGASWQNEHLKVWSTGSNDSGVSWIVEVEGKRLFHAGDLCNWYARFLADTPPPTCVQTEFGTQVNPLAEEKRYLGELKDIRKLTDRFDVVFFPVDARIGNGYTLGARQFIARFQVGLFVPMHFVLSGFESAWRMEPYCQEKNIPFWRINREGAVCSFPL